ncbi:MAG: aminotransferase class I/II-fold pyridoxal phosphate-dependent enzyme [Bdellovibrionota bacterium]
MPSDDFYRVSRLPPYVLSEVVALKNAARKAGEDIVDLGMGNPDDRPPDFLIQHLHKAIDNPRNHRYSVSRGIYKLRLAISDWYNRRYDIKLDPDKEAIVTIGAKEGISHLMLAMLAPGDKVLVPDPTYPIHTYSVIIAGGDVVSVPIGPGQDFFENLKQATEKSWPRPKVMMLCFPSNPTTQVVDRAFFQKVIDFAAEYDMWVIHDLAYADLCFDGYEAPSILQAKGARERAVEVFSMSKSYNMPGWRVGFVVGNEKLVNALARLKGYFDYGIFQPIQITAIHALNSSSETPEKICDTYRQRRDWLCTGLNRAGWPVEPPKATMFVWAPIPEEFKKMGSMEFSKLLLREAKVAVSPGVGFGANGEGFVRFALIENRHRINQAVRGIKKALQGGSGDE